MEKASIDIEQGWLSRLSPEFQKEYMLNLKQFLREELRQGKIVYPHGRDIFTAFNETPFDKVKVVIIGQDPYHGKGQAHGLCFSVRENIPPPPSLLNVYKELNSDLGIGIPKHGMLMKWARQGVFMLNSILTVEAHRPLSHQNRGWEQFTDRVIEILNFQKQNLVFLLWGSPAQKKGMHIDTKKHLVLKAPHPSPLSAYRGFLGCKHFSQTNNYLSSNGISTIDWSL